MSTAHLISGFSSCSWVRSLLAVDGEKLEQAMLRGSFSCLGNRKLCTFNNSMLLLLGAKFKATYLLCQRLKRVSHVSAEP